MTNGTSRRDRGKPHATEPRRSNHKAALRVWISLTAMAVLVASVPLAAAQNPFDAQRHPVPQVSGVAQWVPLIQMVGFVSSALALGLLLWQYWPRRGWVVEGASASPLVPATVTAEAPSDAPGESATENQADPAPVTVASVALDQPPVPAVPNRPGPSSSRRVVTGWAKRLHGPGGPHTWGASSAPQRLGARRLPVAPPRASPAPS